MTDRTFESFFAGLRATVYVTAFFTLWAWLALLVRRFDAAFAVDWPSWTGAVALAMMTLGAALGLACVGYFVTRGQGTPALFDPPRAFVATGPYRYVRNPMYIGGLSLLAGFGLWHRSVSILLLAAGALVVVHLVVVWHEEPSLERKFGASFREYKRTVNRWLPRRR